MPAPTGIPTDVIRSIFAALSAAEEADEDLDAFMTLGIACLNYDVRRGVPPAHLLKAICETFNAIVAENTSPSDSLH